MQTSDRLNNFLLFVTGLLFVASFLFLSHHNRLVIDDWDYLGSLENPGVTGYVKYLYESWSGRWAAYSFTGMIVWLYDRFPWALAAFNLSGLLFLAGILYSILRKLLPGRQITMSRYRTLQLALLVCMSVFFTSYSKGETWFWLVHVCVYLWSILCTLLLVRILLERQNREKHFPMIAVAALYVGGASESYALVLLLLAAAFAVLIHSKKAPFFYQWRYTRAKILCILVFLSAGLAVMLLAPGNENRINALPHVPWYQTVWIQVKSCVKIFLIRTPVQIPVLVLFSLPWLWLGMQQRNDRLVSLRVFFNAQMKRIAWFCLIIFICLLPVSVIMSELGPDRALTQITFLISFAFAWLFYEAGRSVALPGWIHILKWPAVPALFAFVLMTAIRQYEITRAYARAYDHRWELLRQLERQGHRSVVELDPLPPSGYLSPGEITADTNHFSNNFLKHALHLGFEVRVKNQGSKDQ